MPTNNRSDPLNLRFRDAFSPKPDGNEPTGLPTRLVGHGGRIARREKNARRFSRRLPFNELEQHDRALNHSRVRGESGPNPRGGANTKNEATRVLRVASFVAEVWGGESSVHQD